MFNTVEYYLYHRQPLKEYIPTQGGQIVEKYHEMGDMTSVKGNGTPDRFGTDMDIF